MEIKICGITKEYEIDKLIEEKIEYAGFVLYYPKSKRNNTIERAQQLLNYLKSKKEFRIKAVAVVVSPNLEVIEEIEKVGFDIIQIHDIIDNALLEKIKIPIFRAVNIKSDTKLSLAQHKNITGIVLDAAVPGMGKAFDWNKYLDFDAAGKKFILAGGLNKNNVREGIEKLHPDIVDCSSGVEYDNKALSGKDIKKIEEFVREVRR